MFQVLRNIALSLLLALGAGSTMAEEGAPQMFLEDASPARLAPTVEAFEAEVAEAGWSILHVHNLAGILSTKGFTLAPALVFEVCSGKYSARLLADDANRYVTSMIPCRVAIYQTSGGQVIISRMNTAVLASMLTPAVAEVVQASSAEMEEVIARTLARLGDG